MKGASFLLFLLYPLISVHPQTGEDITFSEVMFNPPAADCEFIEIYNLSHDKVIDLSKYKIKYQTSSSDTIISAGKGLLLAPESYAIILEGDYDFSSGIYNPIIPSSALILKINNNAFGSTGMSNSSDRTLYLLNENNDTVDTYTYSADNTAGYSDEKIIPGKDNSRSNWTNTFVKNGTPGKVNSVKKKEYDLEIYSVEVSPQFPTSGDKISLNIKVKNKGTQSIEQWLVEVFNDRDLDSCSTQNENIYYQSFSKLYPDDSLKISTEIPESTPGLCQVIIKVTVSTPSDTITLTSVTRFTIKAAPVRYNDIVINEIMYAPPVGETEWIELYNQSDKPVNLKKWKISDNSTAGLLSTVDKLLEPGQYIVICRDSSIEKFYSIPSEILKVNLPTLNNSGDTIVLSDSTGRTVDSVSYMPSWGGSQGKSLERIATGNPSNSPQNWGTCTSPLRGSPGYENSLCPKKFDPEILAMVFTPMFPLFNDNVKISAKVKNSGRLQCKFTLELYEDAKLLELSDEIILPQGDSLTYSFRYGINSIRTERTFSIKINSEADQDTKNNSLNKSIAPGYLPNCVMINEIMYAPANGEPEWIELFNATQDTINLNKWLLGDVLSAPTFTKLTSEEAAAIPPGYFVISKDSSIFIYHKGILSKVLTPDFPNLNNDEDGIVLKDIRGVTIDSVRYSSNMGGQNGFSLERKSFLISSNESSNWSSSKDYAKSTPGQINSISVKNFNLALAEISFQPQAPIQGDSLYVNIKIQNEGNKDIKDFSVNLYYRESDTSELTLFTSFPMLSLKSTGLLILSSPTPIIFENTLTLSAKIYFPEDEDTTNNSLELKVTPGYSRNSIVINEIMYNPSGSEPEWFELLNNSEKPVSLSNWSFSVTSGGQTKYNICADNLQILPGKYFVITKDSLLANYYPDINKIMKVISFRALGNQADGLVIYDSWGNNIDSLRYSSSWGGKAGHSLERFSPGAPSCDSTNWANSISRALSTPGENNSITGLSLYTRNSVIINEIMYDPASSNSEFIELYNNTNDDIDLADWQILNKSGDYHFVSEKNLLLQKGKYFVLAADSLIFENYSGLLPSGNCRAIGQQTLGLLNTEDRLILKDAFGNVIDSVCYTSKWHNKGITDTKNKSLERVNPLINSNLRSNWNTSLSSEGASPGQLNSIYVLNQKADKKFSVLPNPFSPDNDGFEDYTIINYNFEDNITDIRVKIFDSRGKLVRTLLSQIPGAHGSLIFDGLDENGTPLRMGIYILLLEELGSNSVTMETIKSVVVVARKL